MKIYVGTKTASEYLWGMARELKCEYEIKTQLGKIHANVRDRLDGQVQNEAYVMRLAELILGRGKFSIGYLAVTNHANYYSDHLGKIMIQLTGTNLTKSTQIIAEASGFEQQYIYQIASGKRPLSDKVADGITKATGALVLICLCESSAECFGPGINFTQGSDWEFVYDDSVKEAMLRVASSKIDNDDDDFYIDDETNAEVESDTPNIEQLDKQDEMVQQVQQTLSTNEIDLFEQLTPSMKKLVLEFARKRANCGTMTNEQIVLGYCIQNSGDKSIQDLIRTVSK